MDDEVRRWDLLLPASAEKPRARFGRRARTFAKALAVAASPAGATGPPAGSTSSPG